ncbi:hypothetical protein BKA66DRAFT_552875 [Pyrenochaeta sp. MPI-SDFR-AT-0127]|nr:hypothetical protein BKA66DRAFT_552875 [Pyrenochaeta sp. MPI-SDFR-AT-0127]
MRGRSTRLTTGDCDTVLGQQPEGDVFGLRCTHWLGEGGFFYGVDHEEDEEGGGQSPCRQKTSEGEETPAMHTLAWRWNRGLRAAQKKVCKTPNVRHPPSGCAAGGRQDEMKIARTGYAPKRAREDTSGPRKQSAIQHHKRKGRQRGTPHEGESGADGQSLIRPFQDARSRTNPPQSAQLRAGLAALVGTGHGPGGSKGDGALLGG